MTETERIEAAFYTWFENTDHAWDELPKGPFPVKDVEGLFEVVPSDVRKSQEYRSVVLKWVTDGGEVRFFRQEGCHTSWEGTYWDGPFGEVFPREVVRTEWVSA